MRFKGKEIDKITWKIAYESSQKKIGVRCTRMEAHEILDFIDSRNDYQVVFRPSYKQPYQYYVYIYKINEFNSWENL